MDPKIGTIQILVNQDDPTNIELECDGFQSLDQVEEVLSGLLLKIGEGSEENSPGCATPRSLKLKTRKADVIIQDSSLADIAAQEDIRIDCVVTRLGAGKVRATVQSNVSAANHRIAGEIICPPLWAQIEAAADNA